MAQGYSHHPIGLIAVMLRTWSAARAIDENPLPIMHAKAQPLALSPEFAVACDSLFALTEAVLGRSLVPHCCCSSALSADESALLALLRFGPTAGSVYTNQAVPHGLPQALSWAVIAVRRALGDRDETGLPKAGMPIPARCPFDHGPLNRAA